MSVGEVTSPETCAQLLVAIDRNHEDGEEEEERPSAAWKREDLVLVSESEPLSLGLHGLAAARRVSPQLPL